MEKSSMKPTKKKTMATTMPMTPLSPPLGPKVWTMKPHTPDPSWSDFVLAHVFPNGELVTITKTLELLAKTGFEIRDVEDLREHYMFTLTRWSERLEERSEQLKELVDEVTYRIFRIYFAGAVNGFKWNIYHLNQTLVVKSSPSTSSGGKSAEGRSSTTSELWKSSANTKRKRLASKS